MAGNGKNIYTCDTCGGHIVTVDRDDGTTPFVIDCHATKGCAGGMHSAFYRVQGNLPATFIWRKPTAEEYKAAHPAMKQHFDWGGLALHPAAESLSSEDNPQ